MPTNEFDICKNKKFSNKFRYKPLKIILNRYKRTMEIVLHYFYTNYPVWISRT